jgi:hypothetical protein
MRYSSSTSWTLVTESEQRLRLRKPRDDDQWSPSFHHSTSLLVSLHAICLTILTTVDQNAIKYRSARRHIFYASDPSFNDHITNNIPG